MYVLNHVIFGMNFIIFVIYSTVNCDFLYYMQFIYYSQGIDWYSFNSTTFVYFENFVYI